MQKGEVHTIYESKHLPNNAVALPVDAVELHRMSNNDTHFEHAQNKRHGSGVLITARWAAIAAQ